MRIPRPKKKKKKVISGICAAIVLMLFWKVYTLKPTETVEPFSYDFDIFIVAGQSNAEGWGNGNTHLKYNPQEPIYSYDAKSNTVSLAKDGIHGSGFSQYFAQIYADKEVLADDRKILLLNCAVGGTGFSTGHWGENDTLFLKMIAQIELFKKNHHNTFMGVLWHQGERDVKKGSTTTEHYTNLKTLVTLSRECVGDTTLPFISGDFSHAWRQTCDNKEHDHTSIWYNCNYHPVKNAIIQVMTDMLYCAFVDTDGIDANSDKIHFSRKGNIELAKRYKEKYESLRAEMLF